MNQFEIVKFTLGGYILQEPMALITNWCIFLFCLFAFLTIPWQQSYSSQKFKWFYFFLGLSTFFGGLGHLFFIYTGMYGKFPSWIFATLAGYFVGKAILYYWRDNKGYNFLFHFLWIKSVLLLSFSLVSQKFIFIAIDAILTYLLYCGFLAWRLWKSEKNEMKYFVFGIIVLLPSAFIFLMNINFHRFLNRDDMSHILMLLCIISFYLGVKKMNLAYLSSQS